MLILVIGATGRVGRGCVKQLLADHHRVRVLVRSAEKGRALAAQGCEVVMGDVFDRARVAAAIEGVDGIAACLGTPRSSQTKASDYLKTGVEGNKNLIELAESSPKLPHLVFISSLNAEKGTFFADFEAKTRTEARLRSSKLPWTILKPSGYIDSLIEDFVQNGTVQYAGSFNQPANPIAATDVGAAAARAFSHPELRGQVVSLFGPERIGFIEALEKWSRLSGKGLKFRSMPLWLFWIVSRVMYPFVPIMSQMYQLSRSLNVHDWSGDPAPLAALLGRPPTTIEDFA